ncbi:hypothetical protein E2320_018250 [Naja naja]|nr:hypothetical protein E2320_018250 [Naja naja]
MTSKSVFSPVPMLIVKDPIDRTIEFLPTKAPYDPRWMLAGRPHPNNVSAMEESEKANSSSEGPVAEWFL